MVDGLPAVRADLLEREGRPEEAAAAYRRAAELTRASARSSSPGPPLSRSTEQGQLPDARPRLLIALKVSAMPNTTSGYSQMPHRAGWARAIRPVTSPATRNGTST